MTSRPVRGTRFAATGLIAAATIALAGAAYSAPADAAEITIGANVNQQTSESGTCGFAAAMERPCLFATAVIPGQTMTAPCDGTITRFRLNGIVRPANHYSLRVIRDNGNGTYTGTATSAPVAISVEGVNEYPTSLPISAGEGIGIDFLDSLESYGLRWVGGTQVKAGYFYAFPADGTPAAPTGPATFYYLVNADIACSPPTIPPPPPPLRVLPSNEFSVVKLKKTKLTLKLASAGTVSVTDAKAKSKLLKPSSVSGGPGQVVVTLKLTAAAKKALTKKGKVKARATITFTPTGGSASTQSRRLTVRKARKSSKSPGS
jgi:hypothetical protein